MNSIQGRARRAGALYFLFMIVAIFGEFVLPSFMVPGDAAATARNITGAMNMYRIDILTGFATLIVFIFLIASLHTLLKSVDKGHAMLMVLLVSIGIAVSIANLMTQFGPLVLLSGAEYLSVFTKPQLDALTLSCLRLHSSGAAVSTAFWGLWLFPFGILVMKSGFLPRFLGILLMIAGFAYLTSGITSIVLPAYRPMISRVMMPLYFGEVPIIFWLLFRGAKVPPPPGRSTLSAGASPPGSARLR